jgi:transposase IS4-like protein
MRFWLRPTVRRGVRNLPSRVVVYLLLAGCLFADPGDTQVWHRLGAGLDGLTVPVPTAAASTHDRRRIGSNGASLFDQLRGPTAARPAIGVYWRGLLVCAIDCTTMTVADSTANLATFTQTPRRRRRGSAIRCCA